VEEKRANDTHQHPVVDYMGKQKMVKEFREENPYLVSKDLGVDYRFWSVFISTSIPQSFSTIRNPRL
jgi:hypothetical protein